MAIDLKWILIPDPSILLSRVKAGEFLESIEFLASDYQGSVSEEEDFNFLVKEMVRVNPHLQKGRLYNANRSYEIIAYLISEEYRNGVRNTANFTSMASKLIFGDKPIHPMAKSNTGFELRYLTPEQVLQGSLILNSISLDQLFFHYVPEKIECERIYKFNTADADNRRTHIRQDFEAIRDFFCSSAKRGHEGILVVRS